MSYLLYVALFGCGVVFFLWLRDARIFFRTGLPGFRKAAYRGVLFGALALFGVMIAIYGPVAFDPEIIGIGLVMAAVFLQGSVKREKVWTNEERWDRLTGRVPVRQVPERQPVRQEPERKPVRAVQERKPVRTVRERK